LDSIGLIQRYVREVDFESFLDDQEKQDAIVRRIEIMGEAVKNLPNDLRVANADVPWAQIAGMRDKVIHDYMGVDPELVWTVAKELVGPLKTQIAEILEDLG
jgi:uncharacterized protein with HEPN domain